MRRRGFIRTLFGGTAIINVPTVRDLVEDEENERELRFASERPITEPGLTPLSAVYYIHDGAINANDIRCGTIKKATY